MRNTYLSLTPAQVKGIADALGENFNAQQVGSILISLDDYAATGGFAATTTVRGNVLKATLPAASVSPFASLTTAADYVNSLRTALITAGIGQ